MAQQIAATAENPGSVARSEWVDISLPRKLVTYPHDGSIAPKLWYANIWMAFKSREVGKEAVIYSALCNIAPNFMGSAKFKPPTPDQPIPDLQFALHPWSAGRAAELSPVVRITSSTGDKTEHRFTKWDEVESGSARKVFHSRKRLGTSLVVVDVWAYHYSSSPMVRFETMLTCSDLSKPMVIEDVALVEIEHVGIPIAADFAEAEGTPVISEQIGGLVYNTITWQVETGALQDPQSYRFLHWAYPTPGFAGTDPITDPDQQSFFLEQQADHLQFGACRGKADASTWQLNWGPFNCVGKVAGDFDRVVGEVPDSGNMMDKRGLASGAGPGGAGAQQSFGNTKANDILRRPSPVDELRRLEYNVADSFMRPCHFTEHDGSPMLASARAPASQTWDQRIDERFGPIIKPIVGGMWPVRADNPHMKGADDQHHATNAYAYVLLGMTGSYMTEAMLKRVSLGTDGMQRRLFYGGGSPRGYARFTRDRLNAYKLYDDASADIVKGYMETRLAHLEAEWLGPENNQNGDCYVVNAPAMPGWMQDENGVAKPSWSCWENGICASSMFALGLQVPELRDRAWEIAYWLGRTIVKYGVIQDDDPSSVHNKPWNNYWTSAYTVAYEDGKGVVWDLSSPHWHVNIGSSDWMDWVSSCVFMWHRLSTEQERARPGDEDLVEKASIIMADLPNPMSWLSADWRATTRG